MKPDKIPGVDKGVSAFAMGTMILNLADLEWSFTLLDDTVSVGCTTFDTAHGYGGGNSERVIGRWMQERSNREEVIIISKGAHHNADRKRVTPFDITSDLFDSLARLKTDYIDIYFLHRDNPDVPVGPIVEILNEHCAAGRIHTFGGSNWRHERIQEANEYAKEHDLLRFTVSSPNYGLAEQVADPWGPGCVSISGPQEVKARKWYKENGIPVFSYSSIGRGFFSGRFNRENFEQQKDSIDSVCVKAYCHDRNFERLSRAEKLAEKKGVTVAQIAIAYIINQPFAVVPIVGAANKHELTLNAQACDLHLTESENAWLDLR